jgi:fused signal recognition particle receptor
MFSFIKNKLKKMYDQVTSQVSALFNRTHFDDSFLQELHTLLISADVGVATTETIIKELRLEIAGLKTQEAAVIKNIFEQLLIEQLANTAQSTVDPAVLLMVGVNGSGKTTFLAKLAHAYQKKGKRVLLVAGDTFRAAATEQLVAWGTRVGVTVHVGKPDQDPASLMFDAAQRFTSEKFDHLLIDTAGRLQTKVNLMKELEKIRRVLDKALPGQPVAVWLSVDSMLGQNSLRQAQVFHEATQLDGVVLTKFDGTGKGGIVFAIAAQYKLPVVYITFGEAVDALKPFDASEFVHDLVHE